MQLDDDVVLERDIVTCRIQVRPLPLPPSPPHSPHHHATTTTHTLITLPGGILRPADRDAARQRLPRDLGCRCQPARVFAAPLKLPGTPCGV